MSTRCLPLAVAASLGLVMAVPALGASSSYKGKTSQNRVVTFKLAGGKVSAFSAGLTMMCVQSGLEFNAVIPPKALKVTGGRFAYKGRDKIDSTNIEISGRVTGRSVKGKVKMTDSRYNASNQTYDSCVGSATFTATAR